MSVKIQENSLIGLFQVLNNSVFTYQSSNKLLAMPPPGRYSDPSGSSNDGLPSSGIHFKTSCVNLSLFSASKSGVEMYLNWGLKRNYCLYKICKSFQNSDLMLSNCRTIMKLKILVLCKNDWFLYPFIY